MHRVLDLFVFVAILENGGCAFYLITKKGGVIEPVFLGAGQKVSGQKCCLHKCEDNEFDCHMPSETVWNATTPA